MCSERTCERRHHNHAPFEKVLSRGRQHARCRLQDLRRRHGRLLCWELGTALCTPNSKQRDANLARPKGDPLCCACSSKAHACIYSMTLPWRLQLLVLRCPASFAPALASRRDSHPTTAATLVVIDCVHAAVRGQRGTHCLVCRDEHERRRAHRCERKGADAS